MISIIIPVYNEASRIKETLSYLVKNSSSENISDIFVVDGESTDHTKDAVLEMIDEHANIRLISSAKGRAIQMNTGARESSGNILYFLHADSIPPPNFDSLILDEVKKGNEAGCFKMKFDHSHWWLRLASWLTHFNWRACRGGDQSLFIARNLFEDIGGFNEDFKIFEDQVIVKELYRRDQFVVIQEWLTTSARLYERVGIWKLQYHFWAIYVKRWFGASPNNIFNYYVRHISRVGKLPY
jgi:rSAM/selenodomain-associated transferase 2